VFFIEAKLAGGFDMLRFFGIHRKSLIFNRMQLNRMNLPDKILDSNLLAVVLSSPVR